MMVFTASSTSSGENGFGRYSSITATCASSASARSCLFCFAYVSADSLPCFASFWRIFMALASLRLSSAPGAVFASRNTFLMLRNVSRRTLSRAFIASLMSVETCSKSISCLFLFLFRAQSYEYLCGYARFFLVFLFLRHLRPAHCRRVFLFVLGLYTAVFPCSFLLSASTFSSAFFMAISMRQAGMFIICFSS